MADIRGVNGTMEQAPESNDGAYESRRNLLEPVVVDTFAELVVSDFRAYEDGRLAEGVCTLTNGTPANMPIAAETVFATGMSLKGSETYTVHEWAADNTLTLEVSESGKSVNFTTLVEIPASSSLTFYVVANDGA